MWTNSGACAALERFSSAQPEVPQQPQRLQPIQSFAGQQEAAFESGLRQLSEPVAPSLSAAEVRPRVPVPA